MDHPDPETLGALVDGRLPAERAAPLEAHLASCSECRRAVAAAISASELARFAAPLSPELGARLRALARPTPAPRRARTSHRAPRTSTSRTAWLVIPVALVALVL